MLADELEGVVGAEHGEGIIGSIVVDEDGITGSGELSGGLGVVVTDILTMGGRATSALSLHG